MSQLGKIRVNCQKCFGKEQCVSCEGIELFVRKDARAELLKEVVAELREKGYTRRHYYHQTQWESFDAAEEIELKFGAGEGFNHIGKSAEEASMPLPNPAPSDWADRVRFTVNEDASITQAPSGACEWKAIGTSFEGCKRYFGEDGVPEWDYCPDCGRPVKLKEDK